MLREPVFGADGESPQAVVRAMSRHRIVCPEPATRLHGSAIYVRR
jgi:hypothetical protein